MEDFINYMQSFTPVTVIVRILLTMLMGGIIGLQRGKQGRAAGMRTHILVSVGAALAALTGFYLYDTLDMLTDPLRLAAQVISGIGFLGVGTILIKGRFQITGLTTAAGLWATAAIGIAMGAGFYVGAFATFVVVILSFALFHRVEYKITRRYNRFGIYMEIRSDEYVRTAITVLQSSFRVTDIQVTPPRTGNRDRVGIEANIHLEPSSKKTRPDDVALELEKHDFVIYAIESI